MFHAAFFFIFAALLRHAPLLDADFLPLMLDAERNMPARCAFTLRARQSAAMRAGSRCCAEARAALRGADGVARSCALLCDAAARRRAMLLSDAVCAVCRC